MSLRAVVIGGGVGGLTSALALKRIGIHVTLLEARSTVSCPRNERVYLGLWDPVFRILRKLELYSELERHIQPVKQSGFKDIQGNFILQPRRGLKSPPGKLFPSLSLTHSLSLS
jgi:2-polyprenyl-6-methoxyphenol hydroxylase-like FAD-dependent oxidoreductase